MKRTLGILALALLVLAGCGPRDTSITVSGYVYDSTGAPLAGVRVQVADRPLATTAADGSFSVDQVKAPYRLIVELAPDRFAVYDGLTVADPQVYEPGLSASPPEATIEGGVTGTAAGNRLAVAFASPDGFGINLDPSAAGTTPYSLTAGLFDSSVTGRLYALEWTTDPDDNADVFSGYASSGDLTVSGGGVFGGNDLALDPAPSTHDLEVTLTAPAADYDLFALTGGLRPWPTEAMGIPLLHTVHDTAIPNPATVRSPNLPGARTALALLVAEPGGTDAVGTVWTSVPATDTAANLTMPARPALQAPADGATNVGPGAAFSWSQPGGGLAAFIVSGPIDLIGFTAAASFELPDLASFGASYGAGASYDWSVLAFRLEGEVESAVDELVQGDAGRVLLLRIVTPLLGGFGLNEAGYVVRSPERSFTTP